MQQINIVIICGGPSSEYEISILSARNVLNNLNKRYKPSLVVIDKRGAWYLSDLITFKALRKLKRPSQDKKYWLNFKMAFLALHGQYGEDGKIQKEFDEICLPYNGSNAKASALAFDKIKTSALVKKYGFDVPQEYHVKKHSKLPRALSSIKETYIVKPNRSGSSVATAIVKNVHELKKAISDALIEDSVAVVQQYINGREFTCSVLSSNKQTKIFPVIEIIPENKFFDYKSKYLSKRTQEIVPANIPRKLAQDIQKNSIKIHKMLGCQGFTRTDFILSEDGKLYFLEINTLPGLTPMSLGPKAALASGQSMKELINQIITSI